MPALAPAHDCVKPDPTGIASRFCTFGSVRRQPCGAMGDREPGREIPIRWANSRNRQPDCGVRRRKEVRCAPPMRRKTLMAPFTQIAKTWASCPRDGRLTALGEVRTGHDDVAWQCRAGTEDIEK